MQLVVRIGLAVVTLLMSLFSRACVSGTPAWQDPSPHAVHFVTVDDGVDLEVLDWGGAGRPLVLLTGSGLSAHIYDEFAPKLTASGHVYALSRRGYGASSRPAGGYENQRLADDILRAIDVLTLDRPVLVGHSMAGGEITTLANQHSDRLGGLVYMEALADPRDFPASDPAYRAILQRLPPAPYHSERTAEESRSFAGYRAWQLRNERFAFPESELRSLFATNPDGSMGRYRTPNTVHDQIGQGEVARNYAGIRVPVLAMIDYPRFDARMVLPTEFRPSRPDQRAAYESFVTATAAFVDRWIAHLKRDLPDARVVNFAGAGHYLFLTREADVLLEIQRFVAGLQPTLSQS